MVLLGWLPYNNIKYKLIFWGRKALLMDYIGISNGKQNDLLQKNGMAKQNHD